MTDEYMHPTSPEEMIWRVQQIIANNHDDQEFSHIELDKLMEKILIEHGYKEAVELIRRSSRWYA